MQITDLLTQVGGLQSMARELGISEAQAASAAEALAPAVLGGFRKQVEATPAGVEGLAGILGQLGGGELLDNVVSAQPTDVTRGNAVLGNIFGSKEISRTVAQSASAKTGLDPALLKKMLPMLAMLVAGYMAKQRNADAPQATQGGGGLGDLLGGLLGGRAGGGGLGAMLDANRNGNPLDDIIRMAGKNR
jgi:hypothetical protein